MSEQHPEALQLADELENDYQWLAQEEAIHIASMLGARDELRRQHAEIERLTVERDAAIAAAEDQPPAHPVKRMTDEQIREVLLSASSDAAVELGVPADELGEPDEDSLHSATMVARWVEPAMAAAWGMKLED